MRYILCLFISIQAHAATWVVHGFRDNYLSIVWQEDAANGGQKDAYAQWDFAYDQAFPEWFDSGVCYDFVSWTFSGYSDSLAITVPDGVTPSTVQLGFGWPSYVIGRWTLYDGNFYVDPTSPNPPAPYPPFMQSLGEYWVDVAAGGFDIRISNSQPSDFGKWAWDGSINPNYVGPMLSLKHHGKK